MGRWGGYLVVRLFCGEDLKGFLDLTYYSRFEKLIFHYPWASYLLSLYRTLDTLIRSVLLLSLWWMSPGTERIVALSMSSLATYSPIRWMFIIGITIWMISQVESTINIQWFQYFLVSIRTFYSVKSFFQVSAIILGSPAFYPDWFSPVFG